MTPFPEMKMKWNIAAGLTAVVILAVQAATAPVPAPMGRAGRSEAFALAYIANCGVMITAGEHKILIDALFDKPNPAYRGPSPEIIDKMIKGAPPFDGVDLALVTHNHPDHFDAGLAVRYLEARPEPALIVPSDAVPEMRKAAADWTAIERRVISIEIAVGEKAERIAKGLPVTAFRTLHSGNRESPMNLMYLVELGDRRVFHEGDSTGKPDVFRSLGLGNGSVDLALLHYWFPLEPGMAAFLQETFRPEHIALTHLPIDKESDAPGKIEMIRTHYKDIFLLLPGMPDRDLSPSGPDVVEVPAETAPAAASRVEKYLEALRSTPEAALKFLTDELPGIKDPQTRFQILFGHLPSLNCEAGHYGDALAALLAAQKEGFFYPVVLEPNPFPPYIAHLKDRDGFRAFFDENTRLRSEAGKTARFEYMVRLPENYTAGKKYPLLLVLHGGFGRHVWLMRDWTSPKLESDYITVCLQGHTRVGSFLYSYERGNAEPFVAAYRQIAAKYPVDPDRVLVAGQSAAAHFAYQLMLDELIPVAGIVLAFPGSPLLDEAKLKKAAERGARIMMLGGGRDPRIEETRKTAALCDKLGVRNRLKVFPDKGHEFPDDFPAELDRALEFLETARRAEGR